MRPLCAGAAAVLLFASSVGLAQQAGTCMDRFRVPLQPGATLTIHARPAGIHVVASDRSEILVTCTMKDRDFADEVHLEFSGTQASGKLTIHGGPSGNVELRIEVPRETGLRIESPAGQITVDQVEGNKEIELDAGQIVVSGVTDAEYHSIDASVDIGHVGASSFGIDRGGFFRSFRKDNSGGRYHLRAHLLTGEIVLN
jgi:hypothetical protein